MANEDNVYKTVEITGSSANDLNDAIRSAVKRASATLRHVEWFEVSSEARPRMFAESHKGRARARWPYARRTGSMPPELVSTRKGGHPWSRSSR